MKKIFYLAAFVCIFSLSACYKEQTCICTYFDGSQTKTEVYLIGKVPKKQALDDCTEHTGTLESLGGTGVQCEVQSGSLNG